MSTCNYPCNCLLRFETLQFRNVPSSQQRKSHGSRFTSIWRSVAILASCLKNRVPFLACQGSVVRIDGPYKFLNNTFNEVSHVFTRRTPMMTMMRCDSLNTKLQPHQFTKLIWIEPLRLSSVMWNVFNLRFFGPYENPRGIIDF